MKDESSIFDAEPENLDRLVFQILGESQAEEDSDAAMTLGGVLEQSGGRIGRYKLLSVLGEGGMGIVYLAEQEEPIRRRVALKAIKSGMDSKRVIARFEAERQALALLDHPNIAHVYDAGTTKTGRLYFVMEYVKGLPITDYCDYHKLTIKKRLALFLQVCQAVQHAHQKGIIHRDIKPSNILVSMENDQAIPKIIDFGVAKATGKPLTERTLQTEENQLLGTPEYMSPEQADMANEDIDTRSDVYSLGVLLYVLLTGVLPFDSTTFREGGIEQIRRTIRETDPKTPSTRLKSLGEEAAEVAEMRRTEIQTLAKNLKKELEWIPLKAMRKERTERYRSASELSDDVESYLKGDPLIAGPLSTIYRAKKFVRRHWALVSGIAAVLAVLVAGVVVSTIFAIGQAHARAESEAVSDFLRVDLLASASPGRNKGRDVTIRSFLDTASESLDGKFKNEPLVEASIRDTIGWTYRMLGEIKAAEPHLERAVKLRQEHLGVGHPETLNSMDCLGWLYINQARHEEATKLIENALSTSRRALGEGHNRTLSFANMLGILYNDMGRYDEAEQLYLKNIPIARRVLGDKHIVSLFMVGNLGGVYAAQGRYDEAERQYVEMLRLRDGEWDDEYIYTLRYKSFLAGVYRKQKRYEQAEQLYLKILPMQRQLLGDEHWMTLSSANNLIELYEAWGKPEQAAQWRAEIQETRQK